jgi:hypothetical protein
MASQISLATLTIDALDVGAMPYIQEGLLRPVLLRLPTKELAEERLRGRGDADWRERLLDWDRYERWYETIGCLMPQLTVIDASESKEVVAAAVRSAVLKS